MRWALGKGIINGVTADTLKPKANALRCEVARMFQNAAFLLPPGSSTVSPESKPDPALPMVRALRLSHRQLRAWGAVETDSMSGDYQSMVVRYKLFPELDFYLPYTTPGRQLHAGGGGGYPGPGVPPHCGEVCGHGGKLSGRELFPVISPVSRLPLRRAGMRWRTERKTAGSTSA